MIKYKIDIFSALDMQGFNMYKAKRTKVLSQDTLKKLKNKDTNISLRSLNAICAMLDMQPKDLIIYEESEEDQEIRKKTNLK